MTTETSTSAPFTAPAPVRPTGSVPPRQLLRRRPRVLGGVSAGVAEYLGLPTLLVRLGFVAAAFMGWGLFLYPVLWVVVPDADSRRG